ncbi:MAG TPA: ATP-dependent 6-phosphofructokinase [Elusimicrobiales bacterium]|nr:ATP-dependent 6-phosphofructokinase [Elusimicrobiales bacterium]
MSKKIGILTGGGDCPGLNAVVRAAAKYALKLGWRVIGFRDGYKGLIENRSVDLWDRHVSGILTHGGTILGTSNIANPFKYTLTPFGSSSAPKDMSDMAVGVYKTNKLDALIVIGGDGTLSIGQKLVEKGLNVVGVPKTIDNDLAATDLTFGFDSALNVATEAIDRVHTTAESHNRVMIVETMGRYAGWIALRSGIAGGGDIILLPEIPFYEEEICKAITARVKKGKTYSIVVVSEGAVDKSGNMTVQKKVEGSTDPIRLGGISYKIADIIEKGCSAETRVVVLGHVQRGGTPTPFDRWLATRFGVHAVKLINEKKFGYMVALRGMDINYVKIEDAVRNLRRVSLDSEEIKVALGVGTSFANPDFK